MSEREKTMTAINETAMTSLGDFLFPSGEALPIYTLIHRESHDADYVWLGSWEYDDAGARVFHLLYIESADIVEIRGDEASRWFINGMVAEDDLQRNVMAMLVRKHRAVKRLNADITASRTTLRRQREDWGLLNQLLNEEAENREWCGVYDECVKAWNERFQLLELEARKRKYEVEVEVTATWTVRVNVTASDEDAAREAVEDWDADTCIRSAGDSWNTPDSTDVEIQSVERA